ncbi:MAG: double zinc ribbon domain-containing protein [Candidatus Ozemobacteraceae bacterium]|nr:zinc ribbon domain-containing protein [Candidatus Riflebacteria bacterium]MDD2623924.1 zinc ribbon domain-containing protein [Candidatus Riflebacteria bacterium]NCB46227.1 zinc ribbon domain-containing protein [bacterium]
MGNLNCPKCDNASLDANGVCVNCGYAPRLICPKCAHANSVKARFCGFCGTGTSVSIRIKKEIRTRISYVARMRIKHFATGLAFGTLLALFAFGAMP